MDHLLNAVFFFEEDASIPTGSKPLMLEAILNRPILSWAGEKMLADGVQRFLIVCSPRFAQEARDCFPPEADVIVSEQQSDLMAFLNTPDLVGVLPRAALPMEEVGPGFAYAASGYELQEAWKEKMTNAVQGAVLMSGWLPIYGPDTIAELEPVLARKLGQA